MVLGLAFAPNGRWLASAGKDHTVRLWDLASLQDQRLTRAPLELTGHTDQIYDLAWSATGDRLASASYDRTVGLWDTSQLAQGHATPIARLRGHDSQVRTVAFHPDSTVLVSGGKDQTLRLWRASDGKDSKSSPGLTTKSLPWRFRRMAGGCWPATTRPLQPDRLTLYDYPSGKVQHVFTGHHNSRLCHSVSSQWTMGGQRGWRSERNPALAGAHGAILSRLEGRGETIWAVGFSADGRYLSWGQTSQYTSMTTIVVPGTASLTSTSSPVSLGACRTAGRAGA